MNNKLKDGVSVAELEAFAKRHGCELFFTLYIVLATLLTFFFFGAAWSVIFGGIGGILGLIFPCRVALSMKASCRFLSKQESVTKIVLAVVGAVISFFLSPLLFFYLGLMGGASIHHIAVRPCCTQDKSCQSQDGGGDESCCCRESLPSEEEPP